MACGCSPCRPCWPDGGAQREPGPRLLEVRLAEVWFVGRVEAPRLVAGEPEARIVGEGQHPWPAVPIAQIDELFHAAQQHQRRLLAGLSGGAPVRGHDTIVFQHLGCANSARRRWVAGPALQVASGHFCCLELAHLATYRHNNRATNLRRMTFPTPTVLGSPAEEARRMLAAHWDDRLPVDPKAIARAAGADLQPILGTQGFSGYFERREAQTGRPTIYFSPKDAAVRQSFTIAHELGHMALGHVDAPRDDPDMFRSGVPSPIERHANQFAAELLMPESAVRRMISSGKFTSVEELAAAFGVSGAAMSYRVGNLNLRLR